MQNNTPRTEGIDHNDTSLASLIICMKDLRALSVYNFPNDL